MQLTFIERPCQERYLRPPPTPSLPQTKASSRPSSRSNRSSFSSTRRLHDAQLAEEKLKLQLRHHQEDKQEDARQASLDAERMAPQATQQSNLEAERAIPEANLEVERKALDAAKEERRIKRQLEVSSLEKQVLTKQLSGSQEDDNESLDLQPPRANAFASMHITPPASRLGLGGGFFIPVSDQLPAQEGDAAENSRISPLFSHGYGGDQAQLDARTPTTDVSTGLNSRRSRSIILHCFHNPRSAPHLLFAPRPLVVYPRHRPLRRLPSPRRFKP